MKKESKESKPLVYIPNGAKINTENISDLPPITKYEKRRVKFDINGVKKLVGGRYGKNDE